MGQRAVWACGLGGKGRREAGRCLLWVQNREFGKCVRGMSEEKGRLISDAAQRLDPPAATAPGVTVKIIFSMANMEQASPQDVWTSVMVPTVETSLSVLCARVLVAVLPPEGETAISSPNTQAGWWAEEPVKVRTCCLTVWEG